MCSDDQYRPPNPNSGSSAPADPRLPRPPSAGSRRHHCSTRGHRLHARTRIPARPGVGPSGDVPRNPRPRRARSYLPERGPLSPKLRPWRRTDEQRWAPMIAVARRSCWSAWRRMRDLNPRGLQHPTRFPIVRTRPLCESSVQQDTGEAPYQPKRPVNCGSSRSQP